MPLLDVAVAISEGSWRGVWLRLERAGKLGGGQGHGMARVWTTVSLNWQRIMIFVRPKVALAISDSDSEEVGRLTKCLGFSPAGQQVFAMEYDVIPFLPRPRLATCSTCMLVTVVLRSGPSFRVLQHMVENRRLSKGVVASTRGRISTAW